MTSRMLPWLSGALLLLGLPLALLAGMLPVNEYEAMGIAAVDCDGPANILVLAAPVYLLYGAGMLGFGRLALRGGARRARFAAVAVLCLLVVLAVTPNAVRAWSAARDEVCDAR